MFDTLIHQRFAVALFFGMILKGYHTQEDWTTTPQSPSDQFGVAFFSPLCFETDKAIQIDENTQYDISIGVLDSSIIDAFGQCVWTGIFRKNHPNLSVEIRFENLDGLDQGKNFITFGKGSVVNNDTSILFKRTGHTSLDPQNFRDHFHLKTLYLRNDEFWVKFTQSADSNNIQAYLRIKLVEHAVNCSGAEFTCNDNSCIDEKGVLNGYPDCPDGSDESPDRGFRDCTLPSNPPAFNYLYTGNLTNDLCTPWEETPYSGRGLYGKICRSIPESPIRWPGCVRENNENGTMTFNWIRCPVTSCKIRAGCYNGNGTDYKDTGEFTTNGYRCLDWEEVSNKVFDFRLYPDIDFLDNQCRNPDDREKPWCFYFNGHGNLESNLCAMDRCTNDYLQEFRRYTKVTFDIMSYRYLDIGNHITDILSETACARFCVEEQSFTCRSYTFRYEGTTGFQSDSCKWSDTAPTTVGPEDVFISASEEDTFVNIQRECDPFLVRTLPAGCPLPIGMKADLYDVNAESSKRPQIYDDNITASSALGEAYAPQFARFGNNLCWRPAPFDSKAWIQVDLEGLHIITGIVVQACGPEFSDWVYEFTVQSKTANNPFVSHRDATTGIEVLQGNFESRCARLVEFNPRIYAESIRVLPLSSHGNPGMRFELLGCQSECDFSTGLTDLQAHDASITASSALSSAHNPRGARIQPLSIQSEVRLGWSPDMPQRDAEPWIQISYSELQAVKAVITQGCPLSDAYMESFILYYTDEQDADDEDDIYPFRDPSTGDTKVFTANSNPEALVRNDLPYEITAMFVRLIAITWGGSGYPCMKFEVIGCPHKNQEWDDKERYDNALKDALIAASSITNTAVVLKAPTDETGPQGARKHTPVCGSPLKVGTGVIGEDITITGQGICTPESYELNGPSTQGLYDTIISTPRIVMSYLEIQLFDEYSITAIVTQGTLNNNGEWATKFSIEYARNVNDGFGFDYRPYFQLNGEERQVFNANEDSITPVINQLDRPISATKLKITYYNDMLMSVSGPCIRFDLMGCKVSERGFPCGPGGLKSSGYCMGSIANRDSNACPTIFHYSSGLAILSNPLIVNDVNIQLRQILLPGYSHYLIGLQQSSNISSENFVWNDGTPLLYSENFDSDLDIDFSSTLCVAIDVLDEFSWKALPCRSPELSAASLCQFDIDECLQETDDCSHGCINYPGGFLCSCPHGSYLDIHEQHDCESLCDVYQMHTISSMPNACLDFHPDASFETAEEVCQKSRSRLLNADEVLILMPEWKGKFTTHNVWIKREDPQDFRCYIAEVDVESNEVETVIVDCKTNNTFVCILGDLPQTFKFNTSGSGNNYSLTDNTLYLTWAGLPPWYDSMTSASLDIRVQDNQIVRLYFVNIILRLNDDDGTCLDKLTLWENFISGERNMQGEYCGNLFGFNLESVTNHITLTLEIGELRRNLPRYLTLQLLYEGRECSIQKCNVYCESSGLNITDPQGQLQTFNFPEFLPPYYSCVWTIQLPRGSFVKLTFQEVIIPCIQNYLIKIFSRKLSNSQLLDERTFNSLCEQSEAWTISETNKLIISYETGLNQKSGGFEAIYETSDIPGCRLEPKEEVDDICSVTECNFPRAYLASPSYPLILFESLICLWKITTSPKSFIYFQFIDINVQDAPACNFVLIQEESRGVQFCGGVHELPVYISEKNAIDVQISHLRGNFLAVYEERAFVSSTPIVLSSDAGYTCPDGWQLFDKRCFVIRSEDTFLRWTEALSSCLNASETSYLVSIRNKAEMNFIHSLILNGSHNPTSFYIGLFLDPEMDDFRWIDGSPLSYTDWYSRKYDYPNIQPEGSRTEGCTAIQMKSFKTTDNWFDIPCAERTTDSFICAKPATEPDDLYAVYTPMNLGYQVCNFGYHLFGEICVKLVPLVHSVEVIDLCPNDGGTASLHVLMSNLPQLEYYLSYIWHTPEDATYAGIIAVANNITDQVLCFKREQFGTFQISYESCPAEDIFILCGRDATDLFQNCSSSQFRCGSGECVNTAFVCDVVVDCQDESDEVGCSTETKDNEGDAMEECLPNNFKCNDGACIQISFVCDFVENCPDYSDETNCDYPTCESYETECANKQCIPSEKWCDLIPDCADGSDEVFCVTSQDNFQCYSGNWLPTHGYCDGQRDCPGGSFEDEPETCDYLQANFTCDASRQIPCKNGACADMTTFCLMDHDKYGYVKGCRDLTHLQYCEMFDCPDLFYKCPNSYCVPQHYRCNGKQDCPGGADEVNCETHSCQGAYKCRGSKSCLAQRHVCDGIPQCPQEDDEYFCGNECPEGCACSGLSYSCQSVPWSTDLMSTVPKNIKQLSLVNLQRKQRVKRKVKENFEVTTYNATFLRIEEFPFLFNLDLSGNGITHLGNRTFQSNNNLRILNFSLNVIISLDQNSFYGLARLKTLDLSGNRLTKVTGSPFQNLRSLTHLFLQDSNVITSNPEFVNGLESIQIFHSDRNYYCCLLEAFGTLTECLPPRDEFSSCTDLIQSVAQKVMIWIMALSALTGNIIVIILRLRKKRSTEQRKTNSAQPLLIMNLAIADLLMGCYLLMIAIADASYRGRYGLFSDIWQTSFYCRLAGFLSTISSVASVIFLTVISCDRCHSVLYPLSTNRLRERPALNVCLFIWTAMVILSALPAAVFEGNYYGRSSVCLALPITSDRPSGWIYSFVLFIILNLSLFTVIVTCYTIIFIIARRSTKFSTSVSKSDEQMKQEQLQIAFKVSLLVATDFACWMPIIIMGFLALTPIAVTGDVYAWTAIVVLPINSAVNPYLYTFLIKRAHKIEKKPLPKSITSSDNRVLISASSSPGIQRAMVPTVSDSDQSSITKTALAAMRINRVIAPSGKDRYRSHQLSTLISKRQFNLTNENKEFIIEDLRKALQHLHGEGIPHGKINYEHIVIDELPHGNKRAYLLMASTTKPEKGNDKAKTSDIELTDINVKTKNSNEFEKDLQEFESFCLDFRSME